MDNRKTLTLAYSPCPNDTFIFAALSNGWLEDAPPIHVQLEDIENLNNAALKGNVEMVKVSYAVIPDLANYRILRAGGALGYGCGPLLVTRPGGSTALQNYADRLVAIPGERTTAFLLLQLALGKRPQSIAMRFDKIVEAVSAGTVDAGLIIHESRFTYQEAGLQSVSDLGEWWQNETGLPVPLGAIALRDDFGRRADELNDAIRRSLQYARENEREVMKYVRRHAAEMEETVMRKHIETYVNNFSDDIGDEGMAAAKELFERARAASAIPERAQAQFV